jgi:hypothetical protein
MFFLQEILDLEPKTKYHYILKELNVYPAVKILANNFNKGADGYNKANIVRALIAMQIEGIQSKLDPNRADWGAKYDSNYLES